MDEALLVTAFEHLSAMTDVVMMQKATGQTHPNYHRYQQCLAGHHCPMCQVCRTTAFATFLKGLQKERDRQEREAVAIELMLAVINLVGEEVLPQPPARNQRQYRLQRAAKPRGLRRQRQALQRMQRQPKHE